MKDQFGARTPGRSFPFVAVVAAVASLFILISGGWGGNHALAGPSEPARPEATCPAGGQCFADVAPGTSFYDFVNRLYQQDIITGYPCGGAGEPCDASNRPYYRPGSDVTRQQMAKFVDNARRLPGIFIDSALSTVPIYARSTSAGADGIQGFSNGGDGVYGQTTTGNAGVTGYSNTSTGVRGDSIDGVGIRASSINNNGLRASSTHSTGIYAESDDLYGLFAESHNIDSLVARQFDITENAGYFIGNVEVTGSCTGCLGSTRIDHPLDPENKYLSHSGVASPEMLNIYSGNITTDAKGDAVVTLPDYFEAVNTDFRYQLTVVGQFAQAIVQSKIKDNHFTIKTDKPNVEVSWQVTGVRHDAYAQQHPVVPEQAKPTDKQGLYLHPELYNQPNSKMIGGEEDINP